MAPLDDIVLDHLDRFLPAPREGLHVEPVLDVIEAQAIEADRTRSVDSGVIEALKGSDVLRMSASRTLGGVECGIHRIGRELEAVAARCPSTAWALWNHLCVFHLFVGALGPDNIDRLRSIVERGEWVSFPAGAGSQVYGRIDDDRAMLNGSATFATGARYGDHCGVVFAVAGDDGQPVRPIDIRFAIVGNASEGFKVDPTWDGSGLRASATDDVHYEDVQVDLASCTAWYGANRADSLRTIPVIDHRYREDWVGLSDLWLGWMAVGVVREALREACLGVVNRRALMGLKMVERPTVQLNLGKAAALVATARAAVAEASSEVDRRIDAGIIPDASDYFRQQAVVTMAVDQLAEAMDLVARTLGGNGLREGSEFERRARDFGAMPLHINVHQDRITHQVGRLVLGVDLEAF